jgi:hypothetical protein
MLWYRLGETCTGAAVPQYFFHIRGGEIECDDEEGMDLPNEDAAGREAERAARSLLAAAVLEGRLPLQEMIVVTDGGGSTIAKITYGQAVGASPG